MSSIFEALQDLFRPRWQSKSEDKREKAVAKLKNQAILAEVARTDKSIDIRKLAVSKIDDQKILTEIACTVRNLEINELAAFKVTEPCYYPSLIEHVPSEAVRAHFIRLINDENVIADITMRVGSDCDLFISAIKSQSVLIEIAKKTERFGMRLAAMQRIEDEEILAETILEATADDKCITVWTTFDPETELSKEVSRIENQDRLIRLAIGAKLPSVRIEAAKRIKDERVLAKIIRDNRICMLECLDNIQDENLLFDIALNGVSRGRNVRSHFQLSKTIYSAIRRLSNERFVAEVIVKRSLYPTEDVKITDDHIIYMALERIQDQEMIAFVAKKASYYIAKAALEKIADPELKKAIATKRHLPYE